MVTQNAHQTQAQQVIWGLVASSQGQVSHPSSVRVVDMRYSDLDVDWESGLVPIVSEGLTSLLTGS